MEALLRSNKINLLSHLKKMTCKAMHSTNVQTTSLRLKCPSNSITFVKGYGKWMKMIWFRRNGKLSPRQLIVVCSSCLRLSAFSPFLFVHYTFHDMKIDNCNCPFKFHLPLNFSLSGRTFKGRLSTGVKF